MMRVRIDLMRDRTVVSEIPWTKCIEANVVLGMVALHGENAWNVAESAWIDRGLT